MKELFKDLFTYTYHSNQSFIEVLIKVENADDKALLLMSHLLNAHAIWLARIGKKTSAFEVWAAHPLDALDPLNQENYDHSLELISSLNEGDFQAMIHYQNSKGVKFKNVLRDILLHIINHSTHHRAQIALLLRQQETPPPASDYIIYKRNQP